MDSPTRKNPSHHPLYFLGIFPLWVTTNHPFGGPRPQGCPLHNWPLGWPQQGAFRTWNHPRTHVGLAAGNASAGSAWAKTTVGATEKWECTLVSGQHLGCSWGYKWVWMEYIYIYMYKMYGILLEQVDDLPHQAVLFGPRSLSRRTPTSAGKS